MLNVIIYKNKLNCRNVEIILFVFFLPIYLDQQLTKFKSYLANRIINVWISVIIIKMLNEEFPKITNAPLALILTFMICSCESCIEFDIFHSNNVDFLLLVILLARARDGISK